MFDRDLRIDLGVYLGVRGFAASALAAATLSRRP
jgi:hypothetical protein